MRSAIIISFVVPILVSGVNAFPLKHNDSCQNASAVTVTVTTTYTPPAETPWLPGIPSPSSIDSYPSHSHWIPGVPQPSVPSWVPGVPEPTDVYDPTVKPSCTSDAIETSATDDSTPEPTSFPTETSSLPAETSSLPDETSSDIPSTTSSSIPEPTDTASCRPSTWNRDGRAPSVGTLRAAIIFVDFSDAPANTSVEEHYSSISTAPTEFYSTISYGKLNLELVPLLDQFYRMPSPSSSYNYSRGLTTENHLAYINDALTVVGPSVSFAGIDVLYVLPAKYASEISTSTSTAVDVTALDGSVIGNSITYGQDLYFSWGSKTVNHETGHTMGLPDLYPYGAGDVWQWVGGFDIMGLIGGQSGDYFAWHKWQLNWIEDGQVNCVEEAGTTRHRLGPIEIEGLTAKAIAIPINGTAYVMAEVRSNLGVDADACGTGVLLYTADSAVGSGDGPIRVIDSKPESGGCGESGTGGELNDAPLGLEQTWDTGLGVVFKVVEKDGDDYIVEVVREL
jgi:M6 family metalloprotease-like protein